MKTGEIKEVYDPETGVTFKYTWGTFGWNLSIGDWFNQESERSEKNSLMRRARLLWPEIPVELKAQVELENRKLESILKGTPWPGDE